MSVTTWLLARQWRGRVARWMLIVGVVAVAVTPIVSVVVEQHSADTANLALARTLSGPAPLRVVGSTIKGGITPDTVERLRDVDGIESVIPVTQAITLIDGTKRPLVALGVDCSAAAILDISGCDEQTFAGPAAPVLVSSRLLATTPIGGSLHATGGDVPRTQLVASDRLSGINDGFAAVTGAKRARQMFRRGDNADVAYLLPAHGARLDAIRGEIAQMHGPKLRVLGAGDPPPGPDVAAQISALLGVIGLFGLVVGWLLVRSITRLAMAERSRELAITAALGRSRSAAVFDFGVEAILLGVTGGLLACLGGLAGGSMLVGSLRLLVGRYTGTTMVVDFPLWAIPFALVVALAMILAAVLPEARRAARIDVARMLPVQQASFDPDKHRAAVTPLVFLVLMVAGVLGAQLLVGERGLAPWGQPAALAMLLVSVVGAFGLATATVPYVLVMIGRATRRLPRFAVLTRNIAGQGRRTGSVSMAVTFAVALATVLGGLVPAMRASAFDSTAGHLGNRTALNTLPFNDSSLIDAKIGPELIDRIQRVSGEPTSRETYLLTRARPGIEVAVMASEHPRLGDRIISGGSGSAVLADGEAVIGAPLARALDIGLGDDLVLDAPDGPVPVTVGAVAENINNAGLVALIPDTIMSAHWGWQPPDPLLVGTADGPPLSKATAARLAHLDKRLRIDTSTQLAAETSDSIAGYLAPFNVLRNILLFVVAIAAFTSLMIAANQRRREFALLSAVGLTPGQLRSVALVEAAVVAFVGAIQGVLVGIVLAEPLRDAASFVVGVRPPLRVGLLAALVAVVAAVVVSLVASLLPAQRLKRLDTSAALRGD